MVYPMAAVLVNYSLVCSYNFQHPYVMHGIGYPHVRYLNSVTPKMMLVLLLHYTVTS